MTIRAGDIIAAKSITHRIVVEMREDKKGKQRPRVNTFDYAFQPEVSLLSKVGVFLFLGTFPEGDPDAMQRFVERQLRGVGWTSEKPASAQDIAATTEQQTR